jgi:hypothetical protein
MLSNIIANNATYKCYYKCNFGNGNPMKNSMERIGNPPSLYAEEPKTTGSPKDITLLSALEPVAGRKRHGRKQAWTGALLLVAVSAAYLGMTNSQMSSAFGTMSAMFTHAPHAASSVTSTTVMNAMSPEEGAKPATIITEMESEGGTTDFAVAPPPLAEAGVTMPDTGKQAEKPISSPKPAGKMPVAQQAKVNKDAGQKDRDVDLIAALLAYAPSTSTSAVRGKSAPTSSERRSERDDVSARRAVRAEPGKDVVARNAGDSTESLVKRCRALGWLEGELCRFRVCSRLWGKDAACPANSSQAANNE